MNKVQLIQLAEAAGLKAPSFSIPDSYGGRTRLFFVKDSRGALLNDGDPLTMEETEIFIREYTTA